ncbi:MAG: hypothetical protein V9E90_12600 [Saprospiraceae bacterium]
MTHKDADDECRDADKRSFVSIPTIQVSLSFKLNYFFGCRNDGKNCHHSNFLLTHKDADDECRHADKRSFVSIPTIQVSLSFKLNYFFGCRDDGKNCHHSNFLLTHKDADDECRHADKRSFVSIPTIQVSLSFKLNYFFGCRNDGKNCHHSNFLLTHKDADDECRHADKRSFVSIPTIQVSLSFKLNYFFGCRDDGKNCHHSNFLLTHKDADDPNESISIFLKHGFVWMSAC